MCMSLGINVVQKDSGELILAKSAKFCSRIKRCVLAEGVACGTINFGATKMTLLAHSFKIIL